MLLNYVVNSSRSVLQTGTAKQAHVINPRCDVQIISTVCECGKHDLNCVISTSMPLTSLNSANSEIFTKDGYAVKVIPW